MWKKKKKTCGKRRKRVEKEKKTVGKEENRGKNKEIRLKAQEIRVKAQEVCGVLGRSCGVSVSVCRVCFFSTYYGGCQVFIPVRTQYRSQHTQTLHMPQKAGNRPEGRGRYDKERCIFTPPIAVANRGKKTQKNAWKDKKYYKIACGVNTGSLRQRSTKKTFRRKTENHDKERRMWGEHWFTSPTWQESAK